MPRVLVTGSCGLIGSEISIFLARQGAQIYGVDSNHRKIFFGPDGDTTWVLERLQREIPRYVHSSLDIRQRDEVIKLLEDVRPDLIVHTAAQPSHDRAASIPFLDFEINAVGTLNLLEACRHSCPDSPFVHMSTNKVYGDRPNTIPLVELDTRYEYGDPAYAEGVPETFPIDQSTHSLFGASKLAGDILVQEYGRYFDMPTCCLRGGCLTGPYHSGVELHGFLSYLVKCNLEGRTYTVYGYKGKQVRDNIHAEDVARFIAKFWQSPRIAEVYNLGGGKQNSCSIVEAFAKIEQLSGRPMVAINSTENRVGDHICYYSDLRKIREHYPSWVIKKDLNAIFEEIIAGWENRLSRRNP